ncbi:MAG: tRNA dihydrouridine synthase DusB [Pseudomonadota bacterium]
MTSTTDIRGNLPRIGPYQLSGRVLLSPMAGITDAPFRKLARQFGAALAASEMTTADTGLWQTAKSRHRLDIDTDAEPRVVQIAGSEPGQLAEAAVAVVERGAQIVDINMGCPAKKVCRKLAGSALLQDEDLVRGILQAVVRAVDVPVTLKTRLGWDPQHENILRIGCIAQDAGVQAIAIHGRTRACRYRGKARHGLIGDVKRMLDIPVFANGDINCASMARNVLDDTGADGLLIGRATQGRPWILREISRFVATGQLAAPLSKSKTHAIIRDHLDDLHAFYGEQKGVLMAKKHLNWYCHQLQVADKTRRRLLACHEVSEQREMARQLFNGRAGVRSLAA